MEMIAHSPKMAKKAGVPQSVGKDFAAADKGKKFNKGGEMAKKSDLKKMFKGKETKGEELKEAKAIKSGKITPEEYASGEKSEGVHKMKDGGSCYKEGGKVRPKNSENRAVAAKAIQKAVQAKAPKASDADRAARNTASVEKVKGMKAQMAARNTPVPKAPDADRAASRAAMMQKAQANKQAAQAHQAAKQARPAAPSPQQNAMQKAQAMKAKQQTMQAAKQARPAAPSPQQNAMQKAQAMKAKQQTMQAAKQARPAQPMGGTATLAAAPMNKMKKGGSVKSSIDGVAKRGKTKCMKNGGFVRAADGCASKGKTKGRFI